MEIDFLQFIINNIFACAVAFYSLTRLESSMKANTDATIRLSEMISLCPKK